MDLLKTGYCAFVRQFMLGVKTGIWINQNRICLKLYVFFVCQKQHVDLSEVKKEEKKEEKKVTCVFVRNCRWTYRKMYAFPLFG